ncbi:hypothetical protein FQR65_LT09868 [Abscondita terminalis]|nr:hypothetical protein FQR65_LT09868 [Abscondita terminalis]
MFLQKHLIFVGVVGSLSWCHKLPDNVARVWGGLIAPHSKECLAETHPDVKDIDTMFNGGYIPSHIEMGCYLKCVYIKLKMLDSNGNFDTNFLIVPDAPFMTPELVTNCIELIIDEKDLCKKSLVFGNCIDQGLSV